jgi:hypothetical protein
MKSNLKNLILETLANSGLPSKSGKLVEFVVNLIDVIEGQYAAQEEEKKFFFEQAEKWQKKYEEAIKKQAERWESSVSFPGSLLQPAVFPDKYYRVTLIGANPDLDNKINAIRQLRSIVGTHNIGIREAKDVIEFFTGRHDGQPLPANTQTSFIVNGAQLLKDGQVNINRENANLLQLKIEAYDK